MREPVKLSRERWDSLTRGGHPDYEKVTILRGVIGAMPRAFVEEPLTFDGITFLPAEYVPADEPGPIALL